MVKKISYIVLSIAILISGYFALARLNYWERSIRIFKLSSSAQAFEGRMEGSRGGLRDIGDARGRSGFNRQEEFRGRSDGSAFRQLPDSVRAKFGAIEGRQGMRNRNVPGSLRQQGGGRELVGRGQIESGRIDGHGRGRDGFAGGRKIYLVNVQWFLAVFASFTVIVIYFDKVCHLIWKGKLKFQKSGSASAGVRKKE
jgi:hypothetical protein